MRDESTQRKIKEIERNRPYCVILSFEAFSSVSLSIFIVKE
jgi:hypothetical protein